ncbi:MAG: hypothetical protein A2570_00640 [Candidatus Brennerbacteria bacterium RIFOXYD1_FULL_41_16]|uniref:isoleucine--tRNA ligase n=1 Tax=Candidatus Brennerbacteria bacterium RIFOXYD1_FULL_41_16 TaxID=1797529 RepID=A0A1G1XM41_9BACT|nr:MAG: hypothetical protein A2570_00640 [Candidatus Brennerbacteria bacterium RIFOXYD1_FULL_41_16]
MEETKKQPSLSELEQKTLGFWEKEKVFEKLQAEERDKNFVFYEGPPTANAGPGFHHVIARAFKDIIPRYKTLKGYSVLRKAGWDTHGLPVEIQIEKKLGFKSKPEIEKYGIDKFNRLCQESVWEFKQIWDKFTERIGYWVDLKNPYVTYDTDYMESVWWILKKIWDKGLMEKDYKVVPYCARCGTPLSSHEVALGYEDVEETSVYLKFKVEKSGLPFDTAQGMPVDKDIYLLAWTTTPWTLPGNVALAVNPEIDYVFIKVNSGEVFILAKNRLSILSEKYEVIKEVKGKDLVGMRYEPLFDYLQKQNPKNIENAFQVLPASFATDTDGTGIVHTAVMYGEDDFNLGKQTNLPFFHTVDANGKFIDAVEEWKGIWVKDADPLVRAWLQKEDKLLKEEKITHTYPFCWRCKTPLLYYAYSSWFIRMNKVKQKLIENNKKIHWEPEHLQQGRFGEWLRELKDWALSRDRYWGTPLPVWECEKDSNHKFVVGSLTDFSEHALSKNKYLLIRHGESQSIIDNLLIDFSGDQKIPNHLTENGKQQVIGLAQKIATEKIDVFVVSDLTRTKETAEILKSNFPEAELIYDKRLREVDAGILSGKPIKDYDSSFKGSDWFGFKPEGGESFQDVLNRSFELFKELEKKYFGQTIALVSHKGVLSTLWSGLNNNDHGVPGSRKFGLAESREFVSKNLPYNEKNEIDLHRPYVDDIFLKCTECAASNATGMSDAVGSKMLRVKEVIDVWFDSGAMPLAQFHFPFEQMNQGDDPAKIDYQKLIREKLPFPGDYISEAIDQTRGWFYTLLAISTALDLGPSYLNVVCVGHVLDKNGEKMSKSKGNIVDPWQMIEKYGADSLRWYFYTVNSPGEYKKFSEKDLAVFSQELMTVSNVLKFFELYSPELNRIGLGEAGALEKSNLEPQNLLDKWILSRLEVISSGVDKNLSEYKIFEASRLLREFFDDLSRWYLRRSRKRFQKPESQEQFEKDLQFFAGILLELAKLMAPFTPFLAEQIWQSINNKLINKKESSVHLSLWQELPVVSDSEKIISEMTRVRKIAEQGLALRAKAGIKVRQPLQALKLLNMNISEDAKQILCEELNVKEVETVRKFSEGIVFEEGVGLDTRITEELRNAGLAREYIRILQEKRQEKGYLPQEKARRYSVDEPSFMELYEVSGSTNTILVRQVPPENVREEIEINGQKYVIGLEK